MTNVQVRDVPDAVLEALKDRAARRGQSLQRFLGMVLVAEAGVAVNDGVLDEAAADPGGVLVADGDAAEELSRARAERRSG